MLENTWKLERVGDRWRNDDPSNPHSRGLISNDSLIDSHTDDNLGGIRHGYGYMDRLGGGVYSSLNKPVYTDFGFQWADPMVFGAHPRPEELPEYQHDEVFYPRRRAQTQLGDFIRDRYRYLAQRGWLRPGGKKAAAVAKPYMKRPAIPDDRRKATLKRLRRDFRQVDSDAYWADPETAGPSERPIMSLSSSSSSGGSASSRGRTGRPSARRRKQARPAKRRRG